MSRKTKTWSLAGGARFAREARITTAAYLRQAPIAREWHGAKLLASFHHHLTAAEGDQAAAAALLFGGLGYRPPWPANWAEAFELVLGDEARYLAEADLYILTPQMCDVVIAAAQTLTLEDLELAGEEDLPGQTGLVVLPHPLIICAVTGDLGDIRAFTWRYPSQVQRPGRGGRLEDVPAVRMSSYFDSHGPVRPDTFLDLAARARVQGTPLPPLLLDAIRCLALRYAATPEQVRSHEEHVARIRRTGNQVREQFAAQGMDENRVIGEYAPGQQIDDYDDSFMFRFMYAFWRLCAQEIAAVSDADVNHSAQILADRAGVSPQVRIVRLRRTTPAPPAGEGAREWQHRWVVRMHKVRQWYPSEQQHKVIYRGPYVKGPEGKPLLGGETAWALIR